MTEPAEPKMAILHWPCKGGLFQASNPAGCQKAVPRFDRKALLKGREVIIIQT